jgi:hypothetical protein
MVRFRDPPPRFYEEHHNHIRVRDGYGTRWLTIQFSAYDQPGKRGSKFSSLTKAQARSLALTSYKWGIEGTRDVWRS